MIHNIESEQGAGIVGGTVFSIILSVPFNNIFETIIFAIIGASTSFFVTLFWKWVVKKYLKRLQNEQNNRDSEQ